MQILENSVILVTDSRTTFILGRSRIYQNPYEIQNILVCGAGCEPF